MKHDFWHQAWSEGRTGFNQSETNKDLQEFFPKLKERAKVLVPLCGKSIDLLWLKDKGFETTGVEISQKAVEDFFKENQINFQKPQGNQYIHENLILEVNDFFKSGKPKYFDAIYDRASIVALPPEMRSDYAKHSLKILKSKGQILLIAFEYPQEKVSGPPFSVPEEEIHTLYGKLADIKLLKEASLEAKNPKFQEAGICNIKRKVYLITKN